MKTLPRFIAFLLLLGLALAAFVWSGLYDVAANRPDDWLDRVAETVADRSVERRAEDIRPPDLSDPALVRTGMVHYQEMCVTCHGAPGVKASEIGIGLAPSPPDLAEEGGEESAGELFWIVRNGIRMTGMPAFGVSHTDQQIWAIVALVKRLPKMSPAEYQALAREVEAAESAAPVPGHSEAMGAGSAEGHHHHHEPGTEHPHEGSEHSHP
jgi:mono/diheme cytochrome c family protein